MNNLELFSPLEAKVIRILEQAKKPRTLTRLSEKIYGSNSTTPGQMVMIPSYGSSTISTTVRRINAKCERHQLNWFINGMGAGRGGRQVWIDKR